MEITYKLSEEEDTHSINEVANKVFLREEEEKISQAMRAFGYAFLMGILFQWIITQFEQGNFHYRDTIFFLISFMVVVIYVAVSEFARLGKIFKNKSLRQLTEKAIIEQTSFILKEDRICIKSNHFQAEYETKKIVEIHELDSTFCLRLKGNKYFVLAKESGLDQIDEATYQRNLASIVKSVKEICTKNNKQSTTTFRVIGVIGVFMTCGLFYYLWTTVTPANFLVLLNIFLFGVFFVGMIVSQSEKQQAKIMGRYISHLACTIFIGMYIAYFLQDIFSKLFSI